MKKSSWLSWSRKGQLKQGAYTNSVFREWPCCYELVLFRYFYLHSGFRSCSWVRYLRYRYFDSSHRYFDIPILQFRYFRYFNSQMSTFPIMPSNKHYTSNNCCLHLMITLFVVWNCTTTFTSLLCISDQI